MAARSLLVAVTTAGDKAIAGPLVAAAAVFDAGTAEPRFTWSGPAGRRSVSLAQVDDVSLERRQQMSAWVKKNCLGVSLVVYTPRQLSEVPARVSRQEALGRAVVRAVEHAKFRTADLAGAQAQVLAGSPLPVPGKYTGTTPQILYRGRTDRPWHVWAAYLLARTHRDGFMVAAADECPQYGFTINFGYASTPHRAALVTFGLSRHHRRTAPLLRNLEA